jgi:hypothetical protein
MYTLKHYMPARIGHKPEIREEHHTSRSEALDRIACMARDAVIQGRRVVVEPGVAGSLPSVFLDGGEKLTHA